MEFMAERVSGFGTTIFTEMTALARKHGAINLGQGSPDFAAPDFVKQAGVAAILADVNQYAPGSGQHSLRRALADKMQRQYGLTFDPLTEINVTVGATQAIFSAVLGVVNPGDEVIVFEPYYDSYVPSIQIAGGIPRFFTLRQPDWAVDPDELAALFNDRTRLIIVNTPHNPTGKVFRQDELQLIADLCQKYDVLALTDEVYEHMVYDGRIHHTLASFPGMRDRTITVSSLGKTFSVTGWKVGWTLARPELTQAIFRAFQFATFCGAAPLQEGAATAVAAADSYYSSLSQFYQQKRDLLTAGLQEAGLAPIKPQGTYFVLADISALPFENDVAFCRFLTQEVGVAAIPPSAFYHNPADGAGLARFAFCKTDEMLVEAVERLKKWQNS